MRGLVWGLVALLVAVSVGVPRFYGQLHLARWQEAQAELRQAVDSGERLAVQRDALAREVSRLQAEARVSTATIDGLTDALCARGYEVEVAADGTAKASGTPTGDGWTTAKASWYGAECYGNTTANGTHYDENAWGVAHRSLRFGTMVEIRYNGRTVTAPVFDRGPYVAGRQFDLSAAVARELGFSGVQTIEWRVK